MPLYEIRKTRKFRSLTFTLAVSFLFLSLILLIIITGVNVYFNFISQQKLINNQQQLIARDAAIEVNGFIQEKFNVLKEASDIGDLVESDQNKQELVLQKLLGLEPSFRQLVVLDLQGEKISRVSRLSSLMSSKLTLSEKEELLSITREGKDYIGPIYIDEMSSEPMVLIAVPIKNIFHDIKGTLIAEVNLKFMWELVSEMKIGETGTAYVVDKEGDLIAYNDISRVLIGENLVHLEEVNEFVNGGEPNIEGMVRISKGIQSTYVVTNFVSLGKPDWAVVVELPVLEAYKNTIDSLQLTILSLAATVVLALLLGIFLSRSITKPIITLRDIAIKIGEGNFDTKLEIKSKNEIGDLAIAFKYMTYELYKSKKQLEEHSKNLEQQVNKRTADLKQKLNELQNTKLAILNILDDTEKTNKELFSLKEELKEKIEELELMDKKKDEFISVTAHELKTPLTSIKGFIELLKNKKIMNNPKQKEEYFNMVIEDTRRLEKLITDILDLTKLDLGTLKFNYEQTTADKVINELSNLTEYAVKQKKLQPIYHSETNIPPFYTDVSRLLQILSNLVNNAIKFTEKGYIRTEIYRKENFLHFRVSDSGIGIPKKEFKNLFHRFYQIDSSYTRQVGGSGLGLAICKGLVEAMDGKIWVSSKMGKGTTFEFTIKLIEKMDQKKSIKQVLNDSTK
jgi:methyl-accepting chemotaxis protein